MFDTIKYVRKLLLLAITALAIFAACDTEPPEEVTAVSANLVGKVTNGDIPSSRYGCYRFALDDNSAFSTPDFVPSTGGRGPYNDQADNTSPKFFEKATGLKPLKQYWYRLQYREAPSATSCGTKAWTTANTTRTFVTQDLLTWRRPSLPLNIYGLTVPKTGGNFTVATNRDCLVDMNTNSPINGRTKIVGCHNILIVGGEVYIPGAPNGTEKSAIYLENYTGIAHVEGVEMGGPALTDGIQGPSDSPTALLQIENVRVNELHAKEEPPPPPAGPASWPYEHPDCLQTWQGPDLGIRVDRFTCYTPSQGFYLDSGETGYSPTRITDTLTLKNVNIHLNATGRTCFGLFDTAEAVSSMTNLSKVYCDNNLRATTSATNPGITEDPTWWGNTIFGNPAYGDFVPASVTGKGYVAPGFK